jgi:hypothetical protein
MSRSSRTRDPHLHKPTAVVNGQIITKTDVDQRLALIVLANGGKVPDEEMARLRLQVLRNLIDETLQIQEAAANDIRIDKAELQESFARVAANFRQSPKDFAKYLASKGSSPASITRQIEAESAWSSLLRRKVQPFVNVSQEEVNSVIQKLNASKGSDEYHIGEIYLSATPENSAQILRTGARSSSRSARVDRSPPMRGNIRRPRRLRSAAIWAGCARRSCPMRWRRRLRWRCRSARSRDRSRSPAAIRSSIWWTSARC